MKVVLIIKVVSIKSSISDRPTDDDELLTYRLDMIDSGVMLIARHKALEYGDGEAVVEFWRDSFHIYNLQGKVLCNLYLVPCTVHLVPCNVNFTV